MDDAIDYVSVRYRVKFNIPSTPTSIVRDLCAYVRPDWCFLEFSACATAAGQFRNERSFVATNSMPFICSLDPITFPVTAMSVVPWVSKYLAI
jgi:hypothetical protein